MRGCHGRGTPDHPRVHGEHDAALARLRAAGGIIPACAGSTERSSAVQVDQGDHPRVRGEHCGGRLAWVAALGSSPRARGAPIRPSSRVAVRGIIPACAGSTGK